MKHSTRSIVAFFLLIIIAAFTQTGCRENTIISAKAVPIIDNIHTFCDTPTLITKTFYNDTVLTSGYGTSITHALGTINADPFFGKTVAGIYMQLLPPYPSFSFGSVPDSFNIDSAVLILPYAGYTYGDTTSTVNQNFSVYRIMDSMSLSKNYFTYCRDSVNVNRMTPIGSVTGYSVRALSAIGNDSVSVWGINRTPHLRITLTAALVDTISAIVSRGSDSTIAAFLKAFGGIAIEPTDTSSNSIGKALPYFLINGNYADPYSLANILVYYHHYNASHQPRDTATASFYFDPSYCAHMNWIRHNYAGYPVEPFYNHSNGTVSDSIIMIQNLPGAMADVMIPNINLNSHYTSPVTINKAQLLITKIGIGSLYDTTLSEPSRIFPRGADTTSGAAYVIADAYPQGSTAASSFVDGNRTTIQIGAVKVSQYSINFPAEYQRAVTQKWTKLRLRIGGVDSYSGSGRLIAGGYNLNDTSYKMKLHIIYSKLK